MKFIKSNKILVIAALLITTQIAPAPRAEAGIVLGVAPFIIARSEQSSFAGLAAAIYCWPIGAASIIGGLVLFATSHPFWGGILVGLDENSTVGVDQLSAYLAGVYPEIEDSNALRGLASELRSRFISTETIEMDGQAVRYVTIPKEKVIAILEPTGLLESQREAAEKLILELSQ